MVQLKSNQGLRGKLRGLFSRFKSGPVPFTDLEALLYGADFPSQVVGQLLKVAKSSGANDREILTKVLGDALLSVLEPLHSNPLIVSAPQAILLLGVNGSGKTTVAGKLAHRLKKKGHTVVLAAGDTFRAGAVDQLKRWGERVEADVVAQKEGADPAAVIFDAWQKALSKNAILIADTAGRLHTQKPLLEELKKVVRVLGKDGKGAPHHSFLVLDATIGQNALAQSRQFAEAAPLTGLILTKLDGTARGGATVAGSLELSLPIRYIGIGEKVDDLLEFDSASFAHEIFRA